MPTVRKNGKAYDSADVVISLLGIVESDVREFTYSTSQEHQVNHGFSADATSWSMGKKTSEAQITLPMNVITKLEKMAGGDLLRLAPFDINTSFVNEFNDLVNDTITCKFQNQGRAISGEMDLTFQYTLFVLGIEYNNA